MKTPEKRAKPPGKPKGGSKLVGAGWKAVKRKSPSNRIEQLARCAEAERQIALINKVIAAIRNKGYPDGANLVIRLKAGLAVHHQVLDEAARSGLYGPMMTESGVREKMRRGKQPQRPWVSPI